MALLGVEMDNQSPLNKRKKKGTQAQRRRAKFDSYEEKSGPRKGLTKEMGNRSMNPPAVKRKMTEE